MTTLGCHAPIGDTIGLAASAIVIASLVVCVWHLDLFNLCELTGETSNWRASCRAEFLPGYKAG